MSFPADDTEFEEVKIKAVSGDGRGWSIDREDGLGFFIDKDSPVEPRAGMTVRMYGKGFGHRFRGVFLDGQKVFYRTPAEDDEHHEIMMYGADAADWLSRWDAGKGVWSVEMGGIGPGYEQCIQITAAEVLRHLLDAKYDTALWGDKDGWARDREKIEKYSFANPVIEKLGLSGAQYGAGVQLATKLYMDGPRKIMNDLAIKDRKIQVSRNMPSAVAA